MSAAVEDSPESPPGLTASKSSKASTNRSSSASGGSGSAESNILADVSHFEDIGLQDDDDDSHFNHHHHHHHHHDDDDTVKSTPKSLRPIPRQSPHRHHHPTYRPHGGCQHSAMAIASSAPSSISYLSKKIEDSSLRGPNTPARHDSAKHSQLAHRPLHPRGSDSLVGRPAFLHTLNAHASHHYPSHHHHHHHQRPLNGPMRRMGRNASTPSLAIKAMSNYNRSRSPSPNPASSSFHARPGLRSPKSFGARRQDPHTPQRLPMRHGSWQPSRRSVKELEAECNDEGDEDLPDEASLWNVPLSPRPPNERSQTSPAGPLVSPRMMLMAREPSTPSSMSAGSSPQHMSPSVSPERPSPLRTSVGSDGTVSSPVTKKSPNPNRYSPPRLQHATTTGHLPDILRDRHTTSTGRAKSWNVAMSELSAEARALTETLEEHSGDLPLPQLSFSSRRESAPVTSATESAHESAHEDSTAAGSHLSDPHLHLRRAKTASTTLDDLPPVHANNIMIDPLPNSKEKEAVLSRTRPSWLPPKSKSEERRHVREYQKIVQLSREAEKKRAAQQLVSQTARESAQASLLKCWQDSILSNWPASSKEARTRELYWKGIPTQIRGQVWLRAIGNDLALTTKTYHRALARAHSVSATVADTLASAASPAAAAASLPRGIAAAQRWFAAIETAVASTFPDLHIFQTLGPLNSTLVSILQAYAMYRSDVGFHPTLQVHLIAAFLLLHLPSDDASVVFIALANLLNRPVPLAYLTGDTQGMAKAEELSVALAQRKMPALASRLFGRRNDRVSDGDQVVSRSSGQNGLGRQAPQESTTAGANEYANETSLLCKTISGSTAHSTAADTENNAPSREVERASASAVVVSASERSKGKETLNLSPATVFSPLFHSLFLAPQGMLSLDTASRVWDVVLCDGDFAMIRTAVAVLGGLEGRLYGDRAEVEGLFATVVDAGSGSAGGKGVSDDEEGFIARMRAVGRV